MHRDGLIGKADGLPSDVRDEANRLFLEQQLDIARNDNLADKSRSNDEWNDAIGRLVTLKDRLDQSDGAPPGKDLYLLKFDSAGDGKAVIAMGNPDTADHTAVYVPGTDTTLQSAPGGVDRIDELQASAEKRVPGESVSTIFWLDYDAPEKDLSVTTPGRAEAGADNLRRFTEGTCVAQGDHRTHLLV